MAALLERCGQGADLLGICTGRSLDPILALNGLEEHFATLQTGERHPGKPHPAMLETALAEVGVDAARALMIRDASFDMAMSVNLTRTFQCAQKARITSGGRNHPDSCRFDLVAGRRFVRVTGWIEAL